MKEKSYCVRTFSYEDRARLVEFLETEGFSCDADRQDVLDSVLPLVIDMKKKRFFRIGNVTCAAAAASGGCIINDKEFYSRF